MADTFNKPEQLNAFNAQYPTRWNNTSEYGIYTNPHGVQFIVIRTNRSTRFEEIQ